MGRILLARAVQLHRHFLCSPTRNRQQERMPCRASGGAVGPGPCSPNFQAMDVKR